MVRDTKQTLLFLLFLYCPSVSPKVVLKRKDLGKEVGESERPISYKDFHKNLTGGECCGQQRKHSSHGLLSGGLTLTLSKHSDIDIVKNADIDVVKKW